VPFGFLRQEEDDWPGQQTADGGSEKEQATPKKTQRSCSVLKKHTLNKGYEFDEQCGPQPCPCADSDRCAQQHSSLGRLQTVKQSGEAISESIHVLLSNSIYFIY
jgi:hypothetical protein